MLSPVQLFVTSWTLARQVLLSIGFSRQEYWSGLPFPLPGDLPDPGMEPVSPASAGTFFTPECLLPRQARSSPLSVSCLGRHALHP